jgi:tetratricopeptide (TPR) repeat protein
MPNGRSAPPDTPQPLYSQLLSHLNARDPAEQRSWFEETLTQLARSITAGEQAAEADWTAVFERLANFYFANDTAALLELVAETAELPLKTAVARQTRRYFQGVAAFRQDRYEAALDTFDGLLNSPDLSPALQARSLNARAVICRLTGRLEEALDGYRASLNLWQQLDDDHYQGIVHLNLGIILYGLRRYHEADSHLRQAEQFFQAAGSSAWLRKVQSELGLVQRDLGHWDAALAYFDTYIDQSRAAGANEDVGRGQANRGEVLLFKGELAQARLALQTALDLLVSRAYRSDHLLHLGLAEQAEGNLAAAEAYYRQALDVAQEIDRREILPPATYHLGDVLRRQGENEAALHYFEQAAAVIQETRTPLRDESLKISLLGRWQQVFEALVLHNLEMGRVEAAFAWAERARARAFAEGVKNQGGGAEAQRGLGEDVVAVGDIQQVLQPDEIVLCYFTTGVLEQDMPLLRAIPADNPLREHLLLPARTLLFVLTGSDLAVHDCPLDPNLFATHSPRGFRAQRFLQTAVLQRLSRDLFPVNGNPLSVSGNPTTDHRPPFTVHRSPITLIPHGPLHRVPFTALLHQTGGPVLRYAPSGTMLAQQRQRDIDLTDLERPALVNLPGLAVGYNSAGGGENGRSLRYTEAEVAQVARRLGGQVWTGSEPKKARMQAAAATCGWLHIACHGWFDDADPLASYLETGAGEQLTAREILTGWRLTAELVTLSACETGVSQILRGDEPMGLVRAFLSVGARAVLVTQWPVDDLATFLLMHHFYTLAQEAKTADLGLLLHRAQSWLKQVTPAEAELILQQAAIETPPDWTRLATDAPLYADPVYWAGFVLIGA